jgi:surface protein
MFRDADAFKSNISSWNLSKVTNMSQFLLSADTYNQNL